MNDISGKKNGWTVSRGNFKRNFSSLVFKELLSTLSVSQRGEKKIDGLV